MMKLQPLEGLGLEEEDVRATVALSLCGRSGLPALMIAYGRGNPSVASNGGEDVERQLALMALPRSEAQHLEDAQVLLHDAHPRDGIFLVICSEMLCDASIPHV